MRPVLQGLVSESASETYLYLLARVWKLFVVRNGIILELIGCQNEHANMNFTFSYLGNCISQRTIQSFEWYRLTQDVLENAA